MRTFFSNIRPYWRVRRDTEQAAAQPTRPGSQDGFTLIEVIVSSLMVALIVVGTFTGFQVADQSTAHDRLQDVAAVLAAQSQDQLRSAPASALEALAISPHTFSRVEDGVTFSIKQEARFVGGPEGGTGCSVTEHKSQITNALRITSTVSWTHANSNAKPVVETGVVTPPTGSGLEVDVGNAPAPTAGVSSVTVIVKYTAAGTSTVSTLEGITTSAGCIVFGAIPSIAATVEIPEQVGFVTPSGSQTIEPKEVVLAPNTTTYYAVAYQRGGAIEAIFKYNKSVKYEHLNNKKVPEKEEVRNDTFVVANADMETPPKYEVGSTRGEFISASGLYEPLPGVPVVAEKPQTYLPTATSPETTNYPQGDLFPFPESEGEGGWEVYAGDCKANDPETLKVPGVAVERKWITPGAPATEFKEVPLSHLSLNVYKNKESEVAALGSEAVKDLETKNKLVATITDTSCASIAPNNETTVKTEHKQYTTTEEADGGHLQFPFQPFGAYQLCVYNSETQKTYTVLGEDLTVAGSTKSIYLPQHSPEEAKTLKEEEEANEKAAETKRKTEETQAREKREKEEAPAREKREKEEATEKSTREKQEVAQKKWETEETSQKATKEKEATEKATRLAKEKEELTKWETEEKNEEKKGKHLKPTLAEKKKTQETTRKSIEATEKTAEETRKTAEASTKATKEKEVAAIATRKKEEEATAATKKKEEEAIAAAAKKEEESWNAKKAEEATKKSAREKREGEEAKEGTGVTVASKKTECP
jgi:prepilin-type N-terminal cleavage/methylation domain-containing protein